MRWMLNRWQAFPRIQLSRGVANYSIWARVMIALTIAGWALIAAVGALGTVYQNRRALIQSRARVARFWQSRADHLTRR